MIFRQISWQINKDLVLYLFSLVLMLSSCGPAPNKDANTLPDQAYPTQLNSSNTAQEGYPVITEENPNGIAVGLDKPIIEGSTIVTGYGPAGLAIQIINVTFMGEELGTGSIGSDGTFSVPVTPIENGIRIGLLADLSSIGLTNNDVIPGEEAINIPQVGYFIDSFVVR